MRKPQEQRPTIRPAWRRLRIAAAVFAIGYAVATAAAVGGQRHLIYFPHRSRPLVPAGYREIRLTTTDGVLMAWYRPADGDRPTIAFFDGNGGRLSRAVGFTSPFARRGDGVFLTSYPGYDGNPGQPTEQSLYRAGRAGLDWLASQKVPAPILVGYSLGSGVATELAAEQRGRGLVLLAPFTTLADAAATHMPFLPVQWLLFDRFDNLGKIASVRVPLLITHGDADQTVPFAQGKQLFDSAPMPIKRFVAQPGASHLLAMEPAAEAIDGLFGDAPSPAERR
jgi:fermentation-respiration switch protein FrsA (DUF1100 family)